MSKRIVFLIFLVGLMVVFMTFKSTKSGDNQKYVGIYTRQDQDSMTQLILFDDNMFCLTYMGGSLDLLTTGVWNIVGDGISLKEQRDSMDIFQIYGENNLRYLNEVNIRFDGYSMSEATGAVFAISENETPPAKIKSLFPPGQTRWASEYILPRITKKHAEYIYVGYVKTDQYQEPKMLKIYQYTLGPVNNLLIGFNRDAARALIEANAVLKDGILSMNNEILGKKVLLTHEIEVDARKACFASKQAAVENSNNILKPSKEFTMALDVIDLDHHEFLKDDPNAYKYKDWSYLKSEYQKALSDKKYLTDYFNLVNGLLDRNRDIKKNVRNLIAFTNDLFNKYSVPDAFTSGAQIGEHFIANVYPAIVAYKTEPEIQHGIDMLTANFLGVALFSRNESFRKKIYERILGDNFDINKITTGELLFNIACDFARNKEKSKMLEAIHLAISKGMKPEIFKADADFSQYINDPDFLKAVGL